MAAVITISARRTREPLRSRISAVWTVGIVLGCLLISAAAVVEFLTPRIFVRSQTHSLGLAHPYWTRTAFIIGMRWKASVFSTIQLHLAVDRRCLGASAAAQYISDGFPVARHAILVVAAYWIIFTITPLHLDYQLRTAFYRLTAHVLPLFLLAAAEQLAATVGAVSWNGSWRANPR